MAGLNPQPWDGKESMLPTVLPPLIRRLKTQKLLMSQTVLWFILFKSKTQNGNISIRVNLFTRKFLLFAAETQILGGNS